MRASTLFALTVAILLGLATAVTLKVTGVFDKPVPPPPVVEAKKPDINVLIAGRNLFKGNLIDAPWVGLRPLRADELKHYEAHKDEYLAPTPAAVTFRVAAKNIEADRPLLKSDLEDLAQPENLSHRLLPNMRAVNVAVMKDGSAGGLIQVGEWVDVLLTTSISSSDGSANTKTAGIAHRLRVVAKRNGLFNVLAPLADDKPVNYTLEANPYRSALIEFCKTKGTLTIVPVSFSEQKSLEERRAAALTDLDKGFEEVNFKAPFPFENSLEYQDEDARIEGVVKGETGVGTSDLVRIYSLKTNAPPQKPTTIQVFSGVDRKAPAMFNADDTPIDPIRGQALPQANHANYIDASFNPPDAIIKKCKNCGAGKPK